jgi:hypothetical protein
MRGGEKEDNNQRWLMSYGEGKKRDEENIAELWLSTDDHPENGVLVCFLTWKVIKSRQWTAYPEQESGTIPLVGGQAYFFEVRLCQPLVL